MFSYSLSVSRPLRALANLKGFRTPSYALAIGLFWAASAESGAYVPYSGIIHGTDGATAIALTVYNRTDASLTCEAGLAHWYSKNLGATAPGDALELVLWHDPETGVLALMNATDDRMPLEAIWCGATKGFSATRGRLSLPQKAGTLPHPILGFSCAEQSGNTRLACTAMVE